jgi:hypothetical protein
VAWRYFLCDGFNVSLVVESLCQRLGVKGLIQTTNGPWFRKGPFYCQAVGPTVSAASIYFHLFIGEDDQWGVLYE